MELKPLLRADGSRGTAAIGCGSKSALDELRKRERSKPSPTAEPRIEANERRRSEGKDDGERGRGPRTG